MFSGKENEAWYRCWFGEEYELLYGHRNEKQAEEQVDFLLASVGLSPGARVLDLACGGGRHLRAFRKRGFEVWGADLSFWLLSRSGNIGRVVQSDMRRPPFRFGSFSLIGLFFTSFGYFHSLQEDQCVLEMVHSLLERDGTFFLDLPNEGPLWKNLPRESREDHWRDHGIREVIQCRKKVHKRVEKSIEIKNLDGSVKVWKESVRIYSREEIEDLLRSCGFRILKIFGDECGAPWTSDSPRMSLLCGKGEL